MEWIGMERKGTERNGKEWDGMERIATMLVGNREVPVWRAAVVLFESAHFPMGYVIPKSWLYDAFQLNMPQNDTPYAVAKETEWEFLQLFKAFEKHLKYELLVHLDNVKNVGYRIVPTHEQVSWAEDEGDHDLAKALDKRSDRVIYVDVTGLDADGRRERSNALARVGSLKSLARRVRPRFRLDGENGAR